MVRNNITSLTCFLSIILLSILFNIHPLPCRGARVLTLQEPAVAPNAEFLTFIRTSCNITTYPALCFGSLSSHANTIQTSPMQLARTALSVALSASRSTSTAIKAISTTGGQSPPVKAAMRDCVEMVGDSVIQLRQSLEELIHLNMRAKDFAYQLNSIQTWVSSAITDDYTCSDEFNGPGKDGKVKWEVRRHVSNVMRLTSNALALINHLATTSTTP